MGKEEQLLEEAGIKVPPFDEKEFIRRELLSFKATVVLFAFSIVAAGLSFLVWNQWDETSRKFIVMLVGALVIGALALKPVLRLSRIDITHWKRKEWVGTLFLYGFFWIGFFLLFTNPPLYDASKPVIVLEATPAAQGVGRPVTLAAYVADNVRIQGEPTFCVLRLIGPPPERLDQVADADRQACQQTWERVAGQPVWRSTWTPTQPGTYVLFAAADDGNRHHNEEHRNLTVGDPYLIVDPPGRNDASAFVDSSNYFSVQPRPEVQTNLRALQYRVDGGNWYNFAKDQNRDGWWITNPTYPGWHAGANRVEIRAVEQPRFLTGGHRVDGGVAADARNWTVSVESEYGGVNTAPEPAFAETSYIPPGQTPAPGLVVGAALVALVAHVHRRRRCHA